MITTHKNGFEKVRISPKLDETIETAFKRAQKDKKRNILRLNLIKCNIGVVSVFLLFILSINYVPAFAQSINEVPLLSDVANALNFNSKTTGTAINKGYSENIQQTKTSNDIKISITRVLADDKNLYILYTLNGSKSKENLKNILLSNLQITDEKGKLLMDTKSTLPFLTNRAIGKKGDILIPVNSYNYECTISSLGNTLDSYSKTQETSGIIQLSGDNGRIIPNKIKITFLGFTECYNTNYSKETYKNFISKFNRQPKSLSANCNFDININKKLNSIKPKSYKNIKFTASNTDFEINYLKIYPTYIETQIHLGINKVTSYQCMAVIDKIGLDTSNLPYLIDEKGNKYMPYKSHVFVDSNNNQTITFDSSYFNDSKELYLVINQFDYPDTIIKNSHVKIKVK